ncbi:hypothetical protein [Burkholderia sp. Bp8998]|uniref:hypothetical protein n=1 Tax=Burkholderia sp. Bp8998 TaxID=2184557 RepID=UPI000F596830|nr:hypothetical protein [Burkholderia sp. Bp8998]RQS08666.1 hypothetical protein DIE06_32970 [Burkholderia sp. Bp8998]
MAFIHKRGDSWRAFIKRKGFPRAQATFNTKAEAEAWARKLESEMERGAYVDRTEAERNTLVCLQQWANALGNRYCEF